METSLSTCFGRANRRNQAHLLAMVGRLPTEEQNLILSAASARMKTDVDGPPPLKHCRMFKGITVQQSEATCKPMVTLCHIFPLLVQ